MRQADRFALILVVAATLVAGAASAGELERFLARPSAEELVKLAPGLSPAEISRLVAEAPVAPTLPRREIFRQAVEQDPRSTLRNLLVSSVSTARESSGDVSVLYAVMTSVPGPDDLGNEHAWHSVWSVARVAPDGSVTARRLWAGKLSGTGWLAVDPDGRLNAFLIVLNGSRELRASIEPGKHQLLRFRRSDAGDWSTEPDRVLPSAGTIWYGVDARWDRAGDLHVAWGGFDESSRSSSANYMRLPRDGAPSSVVKLPAKRFHEVRDVSLGFDEAGSPFVLVALQSRLTWRDSLYRFEVGAGRPRGARKVSATSYVMVAPSEQRLRDGSSVTVTPRTEDRNAATVAVARSDGRTERFDSVVDSRIDRLEPVAVSEKQVTALGVERDAIFLVRLREGRSEAVTLGRWPYEESSKWAIAAAAVVEARDFRIFALRPSNDHEIVIYETRVDPETAAWRSLDTAIFGSTPGVGFSSNDFERFGDALLKEANAAERRGDSGRAIELWNYMEQNGKELQATALAAFEELKRSCPKHGDIPVCAERLEVEMSARCAYETRATDACRELRERQGLRACASQPESEPCLRWKYESRALLDPILLEALMPVDAELSRRSVLRRAGDVMLVNEVRAQVSRAKDGAAPAISIASHPERFALYASLLRDDDPLVRIEALRLVASLDSERAMPLLVGSLTDFGRWVYEPKGWCGFGAGPHTVSDSASALLGSIVEDQQPPEMGRVSFDRRGEPFAEIRARQAWYTTVGPYRMTLGYGMAWRDRWPWWSVAQSTRTPNTQIRELLAADPGFGGALPFATLEVWVRDPVYRRGAPVKVDLGIANAGTTEFVIDCDPNSAAHLFELRRPDGSIGELRREAFQQRYSREKCPLSPRNLGDRRDLSRLRWSFELDKLFDLSEPGRYRFRWQWNPAAAPAGTYASPIEFEYWNGEKLTNVFDFEVVP